MFNPLTTATSLGVAIRYAITIVGTVLAILGILGWLTPAQVDALSTKVPELLGAIGALVAAIIPLYAAFTKSSSDKAAEAAKQIDDKIPAGYTVHIPTPPGVPDIVVQPTPGAK